MDLEELTDNKSIANQINIEAMTISTLASSLKTEHGVNIQYDAIIQAANRLFDLADHIEKLYKIINQTQSIWKIYLQMLFL